jgi:hypothetical protein
MLIGGLALKGYALKATDGRIGDVSDFLFDDATWKIRWLVIDTGFWLPGRKVLVHPSAITGADHPIRELAVDLTKVQVKASPDIEQDAPVSRAMESSLYDHYGWDPIWGGGFYGVGAMATPLSARPYFGGTAMLGADHAGGRLDDADPHLRSIASVTGYHIHATDGPIGHLENILVEVGDWTVRYLVVDTRNWWAGQQVLIAPPAVQEIVWPDRRIRLNLSRDKIRTSPPWDPAMVIDPAYDARLQSHYGWSSANAPGTAL